MLGRSSAAARGPQLRPTSPATAQPRVSAAYRRESDAESHPYDQRVPDDAELLVFSTSEKIMQFLAERDVSRQAVMSRDASSLEEIVAQAGRYSRVLVVDADEPRRNRTAAEIAQQKALDVWTSATHDAEPIRWTGQ